MTKTLQLSSIYDRPSHDIFVWFIRGLALALVATVSLITVSHCWYIIFDRHASFIETFKCVRGAINEVKVDNWLINGSLLGAMRIQQFVMWDTEIDLAVLRDKIPITNIISKIREMCSYLTISEATNSIVSVMEDQGPGTWKLCSSGVCIFLYEYLKEGEKCLISAFGSQSESTTFPLDKCYISGIEAMCPQDNNFFLTGAFGVNWRTIQLKNLFT